MAFKMKGAPYPKKSSPVKQNGNDDKLLPSEHKDTEITGENSQEKIIDLEDRIEFIKEDIFNQDGKPTDQQKEDIAKLKKWLKELRAQKK